MRLESAAAAKDQDTGSRNLRPGEGTKLRAVYDLFMANKGLPVQYKANTNSNLFQLVNFYGLDIRRIRNGRWVLAGEWFGPTYVDYIADRLAAAERERS